MKALSALEAEQSPTSAFADDIDGLAGEEEELANLVERLDTASTAYGMETSAEKTKLMKNNTSGINTEINTKAIACANQPLGPSKSPQLLLLKHVQESEGNCFADVLFNCLLQLTTAARSTAE